jgi:hypothetical protein
MTAPRPPRAKYQDVCVALRHTIDTALDDDALTLHEARLVLAVIRDTAAWSRITDRHYLAHIAARSHGVDEAAPWQVAKTADRLRTLSERGIVTAIPPRRGRPRKGEEHRPGYVVGVVPPTSKIAPDSGVNIDLEIPPAGGVNIEAKLPPNEADNDPRRGPEIAPADGPPTEKTSETADRRSSGGSERTVQEGGRPAGAPSAAVAAWEALIRAHLAHRDAHHLADIDADPSALIIAAATDPDLHTHHDTLALAIAAATARHSGEPPTAHLVDNEAAAVARHLTEHYDPDLITATLETAYYDDPTAPDAHIIRRPSALVTIARRIADDRLPYGHEAPPFKRPKATDTAHRTPDLDALHARYTGRPQ